eukprot:759717-Hanusia_phi.AAC.1
MKEGPKQGVRILIGTLGRLIPGVLIAFFKDPVVPVKVTVSCMGWVTCWDARSTGPRKTNGPGVNALI